MKIKVTKQSIVPDENPRSRLGLVSNYTPRVAGLDTSQPVNVTSANVDTLIPLDSTWTSQAVRVALRVLDSVTLFSVFDATTAVTTDFDPEIVTLDSAGSTDDFDYLYGDSVLRLSNINTDYTGLKIYGSTTTSTFPETVLAATESVELPVTIGQIVVINDRPIWAENLTTNSDYTVSVTTPLTATEGSVNLVALNDVTITGVFLPSELLNTEGGFLKRDYEISTEGLAFDGGATILYLFPYSFESGDDTQFDVPNLETLEAKARIAALFIHHWVVAGDYLSNPSLYPLLADFGAKHQRIMSAPAETSQIDETIVSSPWVILTLLQGTAPYANPHQLDHVASAAVLNKLSNSDLTASLHRELVPALIAPQSTIQYSEFESTRADTWLNMGVILPTVYDGSFRFISVGTSSYGSSVPTSGDYHTASNISSWLAETIRQDLANRLGDPVLDTNTLNEPLAIVNERLEQSASLDYISPDFSANYRSESGASTVTKDDPRLTGQPVPTRLYLDISFTPNRSIDLVHLSFVIS